MMSVPPEEPPTWKIIAAPIEVKIIAYTSSKKGCLVKGVVIGMIFSSNAVSTE